MVIQKGQNGRGITLRARTAKHDQTNLDCSAIILANVEKFGGNDAGLVRWARLVHERAHLRRRSGDRRQRSLGLRERAA
jgi:hypothetical protein